MGRLHVKAQPGAVFQQKQQKGHAVGPARNPGDDPLTLRKKGLTAAVPPHVGPKFFLLVFPISFHG